MKAFYKPKTKSRRNQPTSLYQPILQLAAVAVAGLLLGIMILLPRTASGTLAYATDVSIPGLLDATNRQRQLNQVSQLVLNPLLTQAAQAKADDMTAGNYWSHTTPEGKEPWVFMEQAGYDYKKAGENLAYGFSSSDAAVTGWMNSSSHRANLLDQGFTEAGFGFANANNYLGTGNKTIVVALYGAPLAGAVQGENIKPQLASQTQKIARIQLTTGGQAPWSMVALVAIASAAFGIAAFKHSRAIRRTIAKGEKFALHHPALDAAVIILAILGYVATTTAGYIL